MSNLLSRFPIRIQIGTLQAIAAVILAILAVTLWAGQSWKAAADSDADRARQLGLAGERLAAAQLRVSAIEKEFLLYRRTADIARHKDAMGDVLAALDAMAGHIAPGNQDQPRQIEHIRAAVATYGGAFALVVANQREVGLTEKDGLMGSLRGAVHAVEDSLRHYDEPRLMVLMLQMRRHEKDYFARIESKYIDEMDRRQSEFAKALPGSGIPADGRAAIKAAMDSYAEGFEAAAAAVKELTRVSRTLPEQQAAIEPVVAALVAEATAEAKAAGEQAERIGRDVTTAMTATMVVGIALLVVLGSLVARSIYRPIDSLCEVMGALAGGNTEVRIAGGERRDEVGSMARSVAVFRDAIAESERLRRAQDEARERGEAERRQLLQDMADTVEREISRAVAHIGALTARMAGDAGEMANSATSVSADSRSVTVASRTAMDNAQGVASASEQLAASIREIANQVSHSAEATESAAGMAARAEDTIGRLSQSVARIGEVAHLISLIAAKTNLLALNATIEAARAGEAGKGFAVVASEVKTLAQQTAQATEEIAAQTADIAATTTDAVEAMAAIVQSVHTVREVAAAVAAAIEEQEAATAEIARNVAQTSVAVQEVTERMAEVSEEAEATGQRATAVSSTTALVADAVAGLKSVLVQAVRSATA
ncbi:methyl-accepting chemotaxis protein [Magnetospirillum sp. UT-4]|uniref:methyl-accepting chemotaxis protein n=1 Tax=Magnetospirillum sp. UT-4 TaxID=2681467 RepID=UPI0013829BE1|nr:methyl-accepting chemotaxis protein [Magnetospirillum sp. UT-4]CAA7625219.1 Methyl-accepting chemotaxis protein [Magnetospirillum sp. UT-4]